MSSSEIIWSDKQRMVAVACLQAAERSPGRLIYPSTIARALNVDLLTVRRALDRLVRARIAEITENLQGGRIYGRRLRVVDRRAARDLLSAALV